MTLSGWLRDYVYISLGGNRRGRVRTYFNLILTMLLGGLWHGASWNFVIWGGFHGTMLAVERLFLGREIRKGLIRIPFVLITFLLICIGWVFFRAKTLDAALYVVTQMFSRSRGASVMDASQWRLAFGAFLVTLAEENYQALSRLANAPIAAKPFSLSLSCLALRSSLPATGQFRSSTSSFEQRRIQSSQNSIFSETPRMAPLEDMITPRSRGSGGNLAL